MRIPGLSFTGSHAWATLPGAPYVCPDDILPVHCTEQYSRIPAKHQPRDAPHSCLTRHIEPGRVIVWSRHQRGHIQNNSKPIELDPRPSSVQFRVIRSARAPDVASSPALYTARALPINANGLSEAEHGGQKGSFGYPGRLSIERLR